MAEPALGIFGGDGIEGRSDLLLDGRERARLGDAQQRLELGPADAPEASVDDPGAFVSERDILGREGVVIGDDDEFAIEFLRRLDLCGIEPGTAQVIRGEITTLAARGQQT